MPFRTSSRSLTRSFAGIAGLWLLAAAGAAQAGPLDSSLDQFVVMRNGGVFVNDTFSDGLAPPAGEGTFGGGATPVTYGTQGGMTETGGKLHMNSETAGLPIFRSLVNFNTGTTVFNSTDLQRVHHGRAQSNTSQDPLNTQGLKQDHHTFDVMALYDLTVPTTNSNNYGIGLVDNFGGSGPTDDRMRLSVLKTTTTGALRVQFWRNDQTTDPEQNIVFGAHALDVNHDQIVLRLSRSSTASDTITASYAYVDSANVGLDISNAANVAGLTWQTINNTAGAPLGQFPTIFNDYVHTRAEFRQLARDEDNQFDFARLTTGSPVTISQEVDTGLAASFLTFNYRFETDTGALTVMLGGTVLGVINAPGTVTTDFASASFLVDGALLGQTLMLNLTLDGPTGSQILLDSVAFTGLQNGNFASGDLTGWNVDVSPNGDAGVISITVAVPEPATGALLALALAGLGALRRRRAA